MSTKYQLNKEDGLKILKVIGYTVASAIIAVAIDIIPNVEIGANYVWLVPIINTGLVSLKKLLENKIS